MTARATVVLTDALHARPANLLVRMASGFVSTITLRRKGCAVDAKHILDVLAAGAAMGEPVELVADGPDEELAVASLSELVLRGFDGDLVPERGEGGAEGIAIGRALVLEPAPSSDAGPRAPAEERARLDAARGRVEADLLALEGALSAAEASLFAPEIPILRELADGAARAIDEGVSAEVAVRRVTDAAPTDLILDARARLLGALAGGEHFGRVPPADPEEARVLVTSDLVPSLIALAPRWVAGVVASRPEGQKGRAAHATSHASILARGRGLPLAWVPEHVTSGVSDGDVVVIDATETGARVWIEPSPALLEDARARRDRAAVARRASDASSLARLAHLGVAVRVNIGGTTETVPEGAEGVGLVRTELLHAAWPTAPGEGDLAVALASIARAARGAPVVVRLYDAGGDKPIAWLPPPEDDPGARGIALLFRHPAVLASQLAAIARVRREHDVRVLIPLTRADTDVHGVRALGARGLPVGAMIETPEAAEGSDAIARASDFVCIGTNDLTASLGASEPPLGPRVLALIARVVRSARAHARTVTVCGELAGDPRGARVLVGLGVHALSVAPTRLAAVKAALHATTRDACHGEARALLGAEGGAAGGIV